MNSYSSRSNTSSARPRPSNRTYRAPTEKQWNRMSRADQQLDLENRKADQIIARANKQRYEDNQANWRQRTSSWQPNRSAPQRPAPRSNHFARKTTFKPTTPAIAKNPFAGLESDSEDESEVQQATEIKRMPTLPSQKTARQMDKSASTWAGFRENPAPKSTPKSTPNPVANPTRKRTESAQLPLPLPFDWADSDSEDEIPFNDAWDSD